jgi:hypothetical protein
MAASMLPGFQEQLLRRFRSIRPAEFAQLGESGMRALIQDGVATALRHGIETERDVASLIDLRLKTGPGFEAALQSEAARKVLDDGTLPGPFKLQLLHLHLTGEVLEA